MRKVILYAHLIAALAAGVFIAIAGTTGSIMAFEQELDRLFHSRVTYVTPGDHVRPLQEMTDAVLRHYPGDRVTGYGIGTAPDRSYQVVLRAAGTVSVNPYTAEILGVQKGPDSASVFLNTVHQLHLRLLIHDGADSGKNIMRWSGVCMLFLSLSGLYLWWPVKRVTVYWAGTSRRMWFDLHNSVGIISFAFLAVLSTTGIVIGFETQSNQLLYWLTRSVPAPPPSVHLERAAGASPISPDRVLEIARNTLPGAQPFQIEMRDPTQPYFVRARFPEDLTGGGRSMLLIDQYTGRVIYSQGSRTAPGGRRMQILNRAIHTGEILGTPSKVAVSLASLMAVVQLVSGVSLWWGKRRARDRDVTGPPLSRRRTPFQEADATPSQSRRRGFVCPES